MTTETTRMHKTVTHFIQYIVCKKIDVVETLLGKTICGSISSTATSREWLLNLFILGGRFRRFDCNSLRTTQSNTGKTIAKLSILNSISETRICITSQGEEHSLLFHTEVVHDAIERLGRSSGFYYRQLWTTMASNACEEAPRSLLWTADGRYELLEVRFEFFFNLIGKINNGFFNGPIIARTRVPVHRWGPRTKISTLFRRRLSQMFLLWRSRLKRS